MTTIFKASARQTKSTPEITSNHCSVKKAVFGLNKGMDPLIVTKAFNSLRVYPDISKSRDETPGFLSSRE
jgi:hypothetical protein